MLYTGRDRSTFLLEHNRIYSSAFLKFMLDISIVFLYVFVFVFVRRLQSFLMQVANPSVQGNHRASAVEICSCPVGYAGTSCEVCSGHASQDVRSFFLNCLWTVFCVFKACVPGFRRVNGNLYNGVCAACHCHGHASECHEVTGHCLVRPGSASDLPQTRVAVDFNCEKKSYIRSCVADADGD